MSETAKHLLDILNNYGNFFDEQSKGGNFKQSCIFCLTISFILTLLEIPILKTTHIGTDNFFIAIETIITFLFITIYGFEFWIATRLVGSKAKLITSISGFFYTTFFLVFIRLFELPMLFIKNNTIVSQENVLSSKTSLYISNAISHNIYATASNFLVFIGYMFFCFMLSSMIKHVHKISTFKAICSLFIGLILLAFTIIFLQNPISEIFLFAFKSKSYA